MEASRADTPVEIIHHILLRSSLKTVIRCQCVCKEWRSLIKDPDSKLLVSCGQRRVVVISQELSWENLRVENLFSFHSRWPYSLCSCNGLVLFSLEKPVLFLWNPLTGICTKVLELPAATIHDRVVPRLCYDSSTTDYKLLLFNASKFVNVVSLRNKTQRMVPFPYRFLSATAIAGVDFHNTTHWTVTDDAEPAARNWHWDYYSRNWKWDILRECNKIAYFDSECYEFRELPTPKPRHGERENSISGLGIIHDRLCMGRKEKQTRRVEVLAMEKYKVKESWVTMFFVPISNGLYADFTFFSPKNNNLTVLFWSNGPMSVMIYDPERNKVNSFLKDQDLKSVGMHFYKDYTYVGASWLGVHFYVESLASPIEFIWRDSDYLV